MIFFLFNSLLRDIQLAKQNLRQNCNIGIKSLSCKCNWFFKSQVITIGSLNLKHEQY